MTADTSYPAILDGHNDTLLRLVRGQRQTQFHEEGTEGHLDLPRMRKGGMAGGFFAMYTPDPEIRRDAPSTVASDQCCAPSDPDSRGDVPRPPRGQKVPQDYALDFVLRMFALLLDLDRILSPEFSLVRTVPELLEALANDRCLAIAHIEDASPLDPELTLLPLLYDLGLRSIGLVWSRTNAFGYGVSFDFPGSPDQGPGLTEPGKALVKACNDLGIMIDLSHLNEKGFWDVAELSEDPLVATHSCVHILSNSARNLTDLQLDAIAETNGLVGINFNTGFLRPDGASDTSTSHTEIVRHAAYVADRIGIDHVALGSDFDGATMPGDLSDCSKLPALMASLEETGFDASDLRKLAHGNWIRVLQQTWHH